MATLYRTRALSAADVRSALAVDRADGDDVDAVLAPHGHPDHVPGLPAPQRFVELFLRPHVHVVDADDAVAALETGLPRGARRREAVDHDGAVDRHRVETEP